MIARGILLDVAAAAGFDVLPDSHRITAAEIQSVLDLQQVAVAVGDVVLIRTGRMLRWEHGPAYLANEPGLDRKAAALLAEAGAMIIGADNVALEVMPTVDPENWHPVHTYLLGECGVPIMENAYLGGVGGCQALRVCLRRRRPAAARRHRCPDAPIGVPDPAHRPHRTTDLGCNYLTGEELRKSWERRSMIDMPALQMTVAARVAEQLRTEIRQGALDAGMPLRQNEIALRLGVSSTPVREAFQILERLGLVVREGRRGVRVFRPSMQDLINGYDVRGALESAAARMAALRLSEAELESIAATMQVMHAPRVSQETFLQLNARFHGQIAVASGNTRLAELIIAEQAATTSFVAFLGVDTSSAREAHSEHATIVEAIKDRDADAADAAMRDHLQTRVFALRSRLEARRKGDREQASRG